MMLALLVLTVSLFQICPAAVTEPRPMAIAYPLSKVLEDCTWESLGIADGESWSKGCTTFHCSDGVVSKKTKTGCSTEGDLCVPEGDKWTDRSCTFFECTRENDRSVLKKTLGCKFGKICYPKGHKETVEKCSEIKCGEYGQFEAVKLGCKTSDGCKSKDEKWPEFKDGKCVAKKCAVKLKMNNVITTIREPRIGSMICKEENADVCHMLKETWTEYSKKDGKCHKFRCKRKGTTLLKRALVCTTKNDLCILDGDTHTVPNEPDRILCKEKNADVCRQLKETWNEYIEKDQKCHTFKCTRKGNKKLRKSSVCTSKTGLCVLNGETVPYEPNCKCTKGILFCEKVEKVA